MNDVRGSRKTCNSFCGRAINVRNFQRLLTCDIEVFIDSYYHRRRCPDGEETKWFLRFAFLPTRTQRLGLRTFLVTLKMYLCVGTFPEGRALYAVSSSDAKRSGKRALQR